MNGRLEQLKERGIDEVRRFLLIFVYLWLVFGLYVLNETLVLREHHIAFAAQGFALVNAAVMAKVMLLAEHMKVGRRFDHLPLIVPVLYQSALFATLFFVFHVLESIAFGLLAGHTVKDSLPTIADGTWPGRMIVWAMLAVSLLPFFALREISRLMGEGRLWALMFRRRDPA